VPISHSGAWSGAGIRTAAAPVSMMRPPD
jgi:hypothetical protein